MQKIPLTHIKVFIDYSVIKNFFVYSFGNIVLRGMTVLLAPITLSILNPDDYGIIALINSFTNISIVFLGLGLRQVLFIEYFHHDSIGRRKIVNDIIIIYLIISAPLLFFFGLQTSLINRFVFLNNATDYLIRISLLFCFIHFFSELFFQILRYQEKAVRLTTIQVAVACITICLNIALLCILDWGVSSPITSQTFGMILVSCLGFITYQQENCRQYIDVRRSLQKISYYIKLGLPFIPGVLFSWILASGDTWILARFATLHDVGIYSLAATSGYLYQMLILYPMYGSYIPYIFKQYAQHKNNILEIENWNQKNMYLCMIGVASLITILYLSCRPLFYLILPVKYHEAVNYVWFILMGYVFLMGANIASSYIQYHKKTYFLAFSLCVPAIFNIFLNILFIPHLAIYGCVLATLLSYIIYFILTIWYNKKIQKSPIS